MNMDLVLEADRMPAPGESYFGERYHYVPGGKGANQAAAAAKLGMDVTFVGRVGDDEHGRVVRRNLQSQGIGTDFIGVDAEYPTGLAVIVLEPNGENRILVYGGANMHVLVDDLDDPLSQSYDALMMNFEIPDEVIFAACDRARSLGIPVIIDAGPARPIDLNRLGKIWILSPNETEAEILTGISCDTIEGAKAAATDLSGITESQCIVIKLGHRGALLFEDGEFELVEPFVVDAVDSTAAGDAFTAGLTSWYLRTGDLNQAVRFGNAAGAIAVTRLGAQPSLPDDQEALKLFET